MSAAPCAVCGGPDLFATGVCAACADDGGPRALLYIDRVEAADHDALSNRLRSWAGRRLPTSALHEVIRERQPLARVPGEIALAALRALAARGIPAGAGPAEWWYRAFPLGILVMVICVTLTGVFADGLGVPILPVASPAVAFMLLWGASLQLRRPLVGVPRSTALLPARARGVLAASLARLPPGRVRTLILELARVGEATYASLPPPFRTAALGEAVVELVSEVVRLGHETARLQVVEEARRGRPAGTEDTELREACEKRLRLLEQTLDVLSRIARRGAESDEAAAVEASALLDEVRVEAARRLEAEAEVEAMLERSRA